MRQIGVVFEAADHLHRRVAAFIARTQHLLECFGIDARQLQTHPKVTGHFGNAGWRRIIAIYSLRDAVFDLLYEYAMAFGERESKRRRTFRAVWRAGGGSGKSDWIGAHAYVSARRWSGLAGR